ncbi:MAG: hypothetical protein A2Y10_12360 [Planctomycetes bacterium GWF2_41_51]|nr:MAG: hypothetical protein A2Y10_12360 [Planctomycetes bacterium GWF2_41_51]HBG26943.1 hypothetical protein [Phycisphaerales bacterium]
MDRVEQVKSFSINLDLPKESGVYEVKQKTANQERLHIGKASNLRERILKGLILGTLPHSTGKRIRQGEDVSMLVVRWACTDRKAAVEEELHLRFKKHFGTLPEYVKNS